VTYDKNRSDGGFDGLGYTLPGELFPREITTENVMFRLGSSKRGKNNVLACRGQEIIIPEGGFTRMYILANSVDGDTVGKFEVDGKEVAIQVQDYHDNIAQWDSRISSGQFSHDLAMMEPAYIKRDPIAWVGTHRHSKDGGNEACEYCYMFKYLIDLPRNAQTLKLPDNDKIRIFAISAANNPNADTVPVQPLYDEAAGLSVSIKTNDRIFIDYMTIPVRCRIQDAEIRYTLDGSEPTRESKLYNAPITISGTTILKAKAFTEEGEESSTVYGRFSKAQPREPVGVDNLKAGIDFEYYEGAWEVLPDFSSLTPKKSGKADTVSLTPRLREEDYGLRYKGYVKIDKDKVYTFYTKSDDGSKLYIGDEEVVDNDGLHGAELQKGSIALKAGFHPIRIDFFQHKGDEFLEAGIMGAGKNNVPFEDAMLFSP
jgi:hypothetical protein